MKLWIWVESPYYTTVLIRRKDSSRYSSYFVTKWTHKKWRSRMLSNLFRLRGMKIRRKSLSKSSTINKICKRRYMKIDLFWVNFSSKSCSRKYLKNFWQKKGITLSLQTFCFRNQKVLSFSVVSKYWTHWEKLARR